MLMVGFGDIGGGVMFDLMERDLFGGNAGGRLELFVVSTKLGVVVTERLEKIRPHDDSIFFNNMLKVSLQKK